MIFPGFKDFSKKVPKLEDIFEYLKTDHGANLRELVNGLKKLDFANNFESFEVTVTIPATSEIGIENKLRSGSVPTKRIILRSDSHEVIDGATAWTKQYVYLKNTGAAAATLTVLFLK